jgi:predicted Ser/Thr protein kinase
MTRDKTIYEFLQFEPRGGYHDALGFIKVIEEEYCTLFEKELLSSLAMVDETQYDNLLKLYVDHLVAQIKNERLYDTASGTYSLPSETIMDDVEKLLRVPNGDKLNYRKSLLSRIAAKKIENPNKEIIISEIFVDLLDSIKNHYYKERKEKIDYALKVMMSIGSEDEKNYSSAEIAEANESYRNLESKFGYSFDNAHDSIKFIIVQNRNRAHNQGA